MNYTVLVKKNWVGEQWKVYAEASTRAEATELAKQALWESYSRTAIKAHRKPLHMLANYDYDNMSVRFGDGTIAILPE